jgi:uncharacterized protein YbjT (DUF2867 family)
MTTLVLVTGANGYIASRLIPRLLERGVRVRALARNVERLAGRDWLSRVEAMQGDTTQPDGLEAALEGVHTAYYLIHSMASGRGYIQIERKAASRFAEAAESAGVQHIIYLGGLADPQDEHIAPHMRSRIETGEVLRNGKVPVTEFRAGVIVGAGSISFEMIRFLTECFPLMPGPTWLNNKVQPVAAANVIDYLTAALERPQARGGIYQMGGPELMHYSDTMLRYAEIRGLKRKLITLPGIPIAFMARFVDWLTPVPYSIAIPLVGGLQSDSIVLDDLAWRTFPEIHVTPYRQAVNDALADLEPGRLERVWEGSSRDVVSLRHEGFFVDYRRLAVNAPVQAVYRTVSGLGGRGGWLYANWLWRLRGWLDDLVSPPRARRNTRGRKGPEAAGSLLQVGELVDYYRVEALEPGRMVRLHSELRAPGEGWMEWRVEPTHDHASILTQTAFFAPRGLPGFLYWFLLAPLHRLVFRGLIRAIGKRSELR